MAPTVGPHFFVDPRDVDGERALLRGAQARHLTTVLRARPGDPVSLADGSGRLYQARVAGVAADSVRLVVVDRIAVHEPPPRLTVVHALPKGRKLDDVVQRLSEVGVARLIPVHSARSEMRLHGERGAKAVQRWRAVALAAAKQSRRARLLQVADIGSWEDSFPAGLLGVVLWEEGHRPLTAALGDAITAPAVVLGIGPEGGLSPGEVAATGLPAAGLGPTILRTETAALVAVTAVQTLAGRYGPLL